MPVREPEDDDGPSRPTPVREAMEAERDERQPIATPTLRFFRGEEEWLARAVGRTTAGFRGDGGAPLLFLVFARAEEPDTPLFEVLTVGRRIEDIPPGRLGVLLDDARPWRGEWEGAELFPETRKSRSSRR